MSGVPPRRARSVGPKWRLFGLDRKAYSWSALAPQSIDIRSLDLAVGLREGVGCAAPVLLAELIHQPVVAWAAIAAFYTCLCDPGGSLRVRFSAMLALGILGAMICAVALWGGASNVWVLIGFGFVWSFCTSFARVYGEAAQKIGLFLLVSFIVASGSFRDAAFPFYVPAGLFLAGNVWAMLLTIGMWPIHSYDPLRRVLGTLYDRLSSYTAEIVRLNNASDFRDSEWGAIARDQRRQIREILDSGRLVLADVTRSHIGRSKRTDQQLTYLQCADQIFGALIALSDFMQAQRSQATGGQLDAFQQLVLDQIPDFLATLATVIRDRRKVLPTTFSQKLHNSTLVVAESRRKADESGIDAAGETFRHLIEMLIALIGVAAEQVSGTLESAIHVSLPDMRQANRVRRRDSILGPLWLNLSPDSLSFRHASRIAVATAVALYASKQFELVRGYWLPMTVVLILQPYLGSTWEITAKRIVFSSLGGILAAAIAFLFHNPVSVALVIFPLFVATMLFRQVDYGLFVLFLTPQFILISSLTDRLDSDLDLAWARAFDSVLAGVITVLASMLLWPRHHHRELPAVLAAAITANRDYLGATIDAQHRPSTTASVNEQRRLAGLASNNAEADLERILGESSASLAATEALMTIVTGIRRMTGIITLLWLLPAATKGELNAPKLRGVISWISRSLDALGDSAVSWQKPAALPAIPAVAELLDAPPDALQRQLVLGVLVRAVHQVEVLHSGLLRLIEEQAGGEGEKSCRK
ncbi:MAG: FUSC family protein [Deltaproteobacteria bacterium]|nr:FUSC family protein [Deltaproteobacteria bacterium]